MKNFSFKIGGNKYNVDILKIEGKIIEIEVNGTQYTVELEKEVEQPKQPIYVKQEVLQPTTKEKKISKTLSSITQIKSPLPGIILKILVKEGDIVKEGDLVVIIEAMKMENKIMSDKSGKVKAIKIKEGDNVLENDVLIELE